MLLLGAVQGVQQYGNKLVLGLQNWATRPCAVSVEECSLGRRVGNAGLEMDNIYTVHTCRHLLLDIMEKECTVFGY